MPSRMLAGFAAGVCVLLALAGASASVQAQQASALVGSVLSDPDERPVVGATVELPTLGKRTTTDSSGSFRIDSVPAGKHALVVRAVGYAQVTADLEFIAGQTVEGDFVLEVLPTQLATVRVDSSALTPANTYLRDFESRRAMGFGRFLDTQFFEKNADRDVRSILTAHVPGVRITKLDDGDILTSARVGMRCFPQVFMNGIRVYTGYKDEVHFDLIPLRAQNIVGFEYYGWSNVPMQFQSQTGPPDGVMCGTAVFWTK
ncbi:MAG: carboxypeptidase-like regulatory domain-containing protein [Gemmatimonadaceae bacterium]|nr:carboxypeptidase-like regulatory domain-containing protein [Gemmatimonadaceae bacterium]